MATLEDEFRRSMVDIYNVAKDHGYHATFFKRMLDEYGGVRAAKRLLAGSNVQSGLMKLWELNLLDHTVEALVIQERFQPLFTPEEIKEARRRLDELGYSPRPGASLTEQSSAPEEHSTDELIGTQLGRYRIESLIGSGGMASVYRAYDQATERPVALKVLPKHLAGVPDYVSRFKQEAKAIARLEHAFILPVHDYGVSGGYTYIAMRLVTHGTLADELQGQPLALERIRTIVTQVGDALDYAHSHGIVHRDVKPSNILIDDRGNCLLTDFGIAKILETTSHLTRTGTAIGTAHYMSPEQGHGEAIDRRSDIYSLGIILYQMATGRIPFQAESAIAVIVKHVTEPVVPPRKLYAAIPQPVERVILKALSKKPADRYSSAGEMVRALVDALSSAPAHQAAQMLPTETRTVSYPAREPPKAEIPVREQVRRSVPPESGRPAAQGEGEVQKPGTKIEFRRIIGAAEVKSTYLNLTDSQGKTYGEHFPEHLTRFVVIDGQGRTSQAQKHGANQIWGGISTWYRENGIEPGTEVLVRYDPSETRNNQPVLHLIPQKRRSSQSR